MRISSCSWAYGIVCVMLFAPFVPELIFPNSKEIKRDDPLFNRPAAIVHKPPLEEYNWYSISSSHASAVAFDDQNHL